MPDYATIADPGEMRTEILIKLRESNVPEHLHDGLADFIMHGIRTGSFLEACISNDLKEACSRADTTCRYALVEIISFLYNDAPSPCWGSPKHYEDWIGQGGLFGPRG